MEDIRLPADVLMSVMSRAATGPRAACIAATVSPAFRSAADSDTIWSRFLPADLAPLVYPSSSPPRSKKELFLRLSGTHQVLEDGLTSAWLHRDTGAMCYMVAARAMHIVWSNAPQYWRWIPRQDSSVCAVIYMGFVFNFGDEPEGACPGEKITIGKLDFVADQFGDLCLPELDPAEEGEQSLQIRAFATGLEEAVDAGESPLTDHIKRYVHLFAEPGQEHGQGHIATFHIRKVPRMR